MRYRLQRHDGTDYSATHGTDSALSSTSREFGEHWENLKSFRDWYSVMSTQLKKGREEDLKEGLETGL